MTSEGGESAGSAIESLRLTSEDIANAVRETLKDSDLSEAVPDSQRLEERISAHSEDLARELTSELTAFEAAASAYYLAVAEAAEKKELIKWVCGGLVVLFGSVALIALYALLYATVGLRLGWNPTEFVDPGEGESLTSKARDLLVGEIIISVLTGVGYVWLSEHFDGPVAAPKLALERQTLLLREALKVRVDGVARRLANSDEFTRRRSVVTLSTMTAPLLIEQDYAKDSIIGATQRTVEDLIREHKSTAIGLAGPRGVGKTTLMRRLETDLRDFHVVYVPVPVYYSASDFVRHLHIQVADAILGESPRPATNEASPISRWLVSVLLIIFIGASTLGVVSLISPDLFRAGRLEPLTRLSVPLLIASAVSIGGAVVLWRWRKEPMRRSEVTPRDPATLATRELERLSWRTSLQTSSRWSLPIAKASFERVAARSLEERELSHLDSVAAFREFIRRYASMNGSRPIVVTVDELDKIGDAAKAVEMINGAKDLLHIDQTHFVVSVSEEALAGYALRGLSVRDVFDSAFDVVLDVKPLTPTESLALLDRRVLDFPVPVGLLCHSVAGGLPRDLIRGARYCVSVRRGSESPVSVAALAEALTRRELSDALDAAVRSNSRETGALGILRLREELESGAALTYDTISSALGDDEHAPDGALSIFAHFMETIYEYYSAPRDHEAWNAIIADGSAQKCAAALASVQRTLPISIQAAAARLIAARRLCGLAEHQIVSSAIERES